ncbi:gamma-glutamyltransferase [Paracoccus xiamenensis]|uniref:gamma-glutamyltransferase n=1 Tax=Paracoccus xiamenensis TaxID=2714901 RepID=UPI0014078023|nr:gamma-glutamyltransferase [Paracoccus xiamenensis]NHF74408.1 gamma-glutamyltransferase [Paracoccus xiamenensis]
MTSSLSRTQTTRKAVIRNKGGVVAAQNSRAAQVGAEVLAAGGNAMDAATAVSFAIGVLEPWMSGPAGGGAMMVWDASEGRAHAVTYGMRSPAALDPADYPLSGAGQASDLFPWEAVVEDRNVIGATAVAVPGVVDGIGQAHARWGSLSWADLLNPAIGFAREGLPVDWYAALVIAGSARELARDPDAAARFLEDGQWPMIAGWTSLSSKSVDMSAMVPTLSELAERGYRTFYDGDLAEALTRDVQAKGGSLSREDLAGYRAEISDPLTFRRGSASLHVTPRLTAGPTLRQAFEAMAPIGAPPGPADYAAYARALRQAYQQRLNTMGDDGEVPTAPGCTTHFSVVDRQGNMVAMTQTLLSIFGAKVISPSTGLLLNNGIMWFDPVQGRPNSLRPGRQCLMNVCPAIGEDGDRRFAVGASGGRKIVSAVAQLSSFMLDAGMDIEAAFHQPRLDMSMAEVIVADDKLPPEVIAAVEDVAPVITARRTTWPFAFACPAGVLREGEVNSGCTEIMSPWGDAITEDEVSHVLA